MKMFSRFNTIRFRLSMVVGLLTVLYSFILISYFIYTYSSTLMSHAVEKSDVWANIYAENIKSEIEAALDVSRATAQMFSCQVNPDYSLHLTRNDANLILRNIVDKNSFLLGIYTAWEPDKFDGNDIEYKGVPNNHPDGHFVPYWYRDTQTEKLGYEPLKEYLKEGKGDYYLKPRITKKETVIDPILYKIGDKEVLLMTLVVPILTPENEFVGIVGSDISTEALQKIIAKSNLFEGFGELSVISNNGTIVAITNKDNLIGQNIEKIFPKISAKIKSLTNKESFIENDTLHTIVPIYLGATVTPWFIGIKVPLAYLTKGLSNELIKLTTFGFVFLAFLLFVASYYILKFLKPIKKITSVAQKLASGNLHVWDVDSTTLEINKLNIAFQDVIKSQKGIAEVTEAIAIGDYTKRAIVKSDKDVLAISVNQMIDNLQKSTDEANKRKWTNEGYAKFAELLRMEHDLKKLAQMSLSYLISYLKLNQGSIFLAQGEGKETTLELVATYAYNREKFLKKTISIGEGLIGQTYLEKQTVYMTDIPSNYIQITSGIGQASPKCLVIIPLLNNDNVEGVLEMASFFNLEPHQIDFLEKCAISLASVISNARINDLTHHLLEEAKQQAELMKMQEEEMRQNMEELAATQEEMRRREDGYLAKIELLERG